MLRNTSHPLTRVKDFPLFNKTQTLKRVSWVAKCATFLVAGTWFKVHSNLQENESSATPPPSYEPFTTYGNGK